MSELSDARIILHFDVHEPIELVELTLSFGALAKQYRKYLVAESRHKGAKLNDADVKLYITRIENNCILAELAGASSILGTLMPLMEYVSYFEGFTKRVDAMVRYFIELAARKDTICSSEIEYNNKECEDIGNLMKVVSKNKGGALGLSVIQYEKSEGTSDTKLSIRFSSDEAYEAQKGALIAQRVLEHGNDAEYANVLMFYHQTNIENPKSEGRTGDKAIIKSISDKPLPVYIVSELDQDRVKALVDDPHLNPFKASYRVDVNVETDRNGLPRYYRVLRVHEIIPDEE